MRNKLKILSLGVLLTGIFGLAACDTVEVKLPEEIQSEKIIDINDKIPHNEIQELFESVVPGNSATASKVLDTLLVKLAKSYFGDFYNLRKMVEGNDVNGIKEFVNAHLSRFEIKKADGTRDNDAEVKGVVDLYEHMLISIQKSFWGNVSNSTYQDRYFFSEKKFYDTQKAALYALNDAYGEALDANDHLTQVDGTKNYRDVDEFFGDANHSFLDVYSDYIERALLPDIYRNVIVENYLQRNNYSALGRSHARKVQFISLKNIDDGGDATRNLITKYANYILEGKILEDAGKPASVNANNLQELRDFKFLSRLYAGLIDVDLLGSYEADVAKYLYAKADWASDVIDTDEDGNDETFYPFTTLGKIYKDYKEISNVRWETSGTTDFTGNGAYTKRTGLMLKEREVFSKSSVTEGWYTSSGLSELPSDLRSRLFKIQVANDVDSNYDENYQVIPTKELNYGNYVEGSYYMTPETYDAKTEHPYVIFDDSSSSWMILRVDEAVKGPKLAKGDDSKASYDFLASKGLRANKEEDQNQIVWLISGMIADSDTYTKAARQEIIEKANLVYHDQNVYDYFETNFPDLFD